MFILSLTPAKTKLLHRTFLRGDEINHLGTGTQLIRRVIDLGLYEDGVPFPVCHPSPYRQLGLVRRDTLHKLGVEALGHPGGLQLPQDHPAGQLIHQRSLYTSVQRT